MKSNLVTTWSGHRGAIYAITNNENLIFSTGGDGWIVEWNIDYPQYDGKLIATIGAPCFSLFYLKGFQLLLAGDMNGYLYWVDVKNYNIVKKIKAHQGIIYGIYFCSIFQRIYTISADGYLSIWDANQKRVLESIQLCNKSLRTLCFTNEWIWVGTSDDSLYKLNRKSVTIVDIIHKAHNDSIFTIVHDGQNQLLTGGKDAKLTIRDSNNGKAIQTIDAHWFALNSALILPQMNLVFTGSRDKSVRIWDSNSFKLLQTINSSTNGHLRSVNILHYYDKKNIILSGSDDFTIKLWQL